jgi:hypothetical protein
MTDGYHVLWAGSIDGAGNADVQNVTFKIDKTPPVPQMGALPATSPSTFTVSWSATDTYAGVKDYTVRYRQAPKNTNSFGSYVTWKTNTTLTSSTFTSATGKKTCFSVRARDNAANTSAYSAEKCTTVP